MREIEHICINFNCSDRHKDKTTHVVEDIVQFEGMTARYMQLKCKTCGNIHHEVIPKVSKKKQSWPRYHEGLGQSFESESHEKKWTKANGYTPE